MLAMCAERDGLVVSLSRIVAAVPPEDLAQRTRATATVFGRLLAETRPGVTAPALYTAVADAYAAAGYPGEELKHHQGGAIGYRAREWVAHPKSQESCSSGRRSRGTHDHGTKVEDTALVIGDDIEIITATPRWPTIEIDGGLEASDIWLR